MAVLTCSWIVRTAVLDPPAFRDALEVLTDARRRLAFPHPCHNAHEMVGTTHAVRGVDAPDGVERAPYVHARVLDVEPCGQHADDDLVLSAHAHGGSNDRGVRPETTFPQFM